MEQLRGVVYAELTPSPAGALDRNTSGYVDYLDAYGRSLGGGESPPAGTVYVRRWSIERLPANYRLLIAAHYLHGVQYEDLAEALQLPLGTLKTQLYRAKQQLRRLLENELR